MEVGEHHAWGKSPGTHFRGGWWAPEPVWTLWEREELPSLPRPGIEPRSSIS